MILIDKSEESNTDKEEKGSRQKRGENREEEQEADMKSWGVNQNWEYLGMKPTENMKKENRSK